MYAAVLCVVDQPSRGKNLEVVEEVRQYEVYGYFRYFLSNHILQSIEKVQNEKIHNECNYLNINSFPSRKYNFNHYHYHEGNSQLRYRKRFSML